MGYYRHVAIETSRNAGEASSKSLRARPLPGQGLDTGMRVECSAKMRDSHPPGTVFIIQAQVTDREGGPPFLYTHFNWPYRVVARTDAEAMIARREVR
jgi:hypothetical protein